MAESTGENNEYINPIQMRNNLIEELEKEIGELREAAAIAEKEKTKENKETEKMNEASDTELKGEIEQKNKEIEKKRPRNQRTERTMHHPERQIS